jgi:uncharacterized protein (TIGR00661 family)
LISRRLKRILAQFYTIIIKSNNHLCSFPFFTQIVNYLETSDHNTVLVAALDWGLGHATRTVPVIRRFQKEGKIVILASAGSAFNFYQSYFPELKLLRKPAYGISYFKQISFTLSITLQLPSILLTVIRENIWLRKIISEYNIDHVVSDNCYGLFNRKIKSTFITHQLRIICPPSLKIFEPLLHRLVKTFVRKYDECLVPDYEGENNLSGSLSHHPGIPENVKYIGPLSRFVKNDNPKTHPAFDVVVLLSGPEPQRTLFEESYERIFKDQQKKVCFIRAKPGERISRKNTENMTWHNHLPDDELVSILLNAKQIICRSGYSTIMDLITLNKGALLIPTPGQTEQEYLAEWNSKKRPELFNTKY